jgi:hypothetical protein
VRRIRRRDKVCGSLYRSDPAAGACGCAVHLCGLPADHGGEHFCWACLAAFWGALPYSELLEPAVTGLSE